MHIINSVELKMFVLIISQIDKEQTAAQPSKTKKFFWWEIQGSNLIMRPYKDRPVPVWVISHS